LKVADTQPFLSDCGIDKIEKDIMTRDLHREIVGLLKSLPDINRRVIELRFGLNDGVSHTLQDIARIIGKFKSGERARAAEAKGLRMIRHPSRSRILKEYLENIEEINSREWNIVVNKRRC
jgi:RNA polymerase primary sigma factor